MSLSSPLPFPASSASLCLLPGIGLCALLALAATALHALPGLGAFSAMILAILLGMAFHNLVGTPGWAQAGAVFSVRRILRLAIVLLGLQLTVQQLAQVGMTGLFIVVATLTVSFLFTRWLGGVLGVEEKLSTLIAAGTAVCGASAVVAVDGVTHAPDEDVAYAVACVTVFGGIAMFLYPALGPALPPHVYGLWTGASIHEIAQVVAAGFQRGPEAGHAATIAKLARVSLLAPLVLVLGFRRRRDTAAAGGPLPLPGFLLAFVATVLLNSVVVVPAAIKADIAMMTTFLLALSLAAMGLGTDIAKLRAKGLRPLALGAAAWLFIAGFSLLLVEELM
jgi:uncharacterized integral membrane protein (TIGR00698 family)